MHLQRKAFVQDQEQALFNPLEYISELRVKKNSDALLGLRGYYYSVKKEGKHLRAAFHILAKSKNYIVKKNRCEIYSKY